MQVMPALLADGTPASVLLLAGTNDVTQEAAPQNTVGQDIRATLNTIAATSPLIHTYVGTLPVISPEHTDPAKVTAVNAAITATVQKAIADGLNVSLVSMSDLTLSDLYDGKHPNQTGYAKMAQDWFSAILATQPADGGTPGGVAHTIATNVRDVLGSNFNDLIVGDAGANQLSGGSGNDRLEGGGGTDLLVGGTGMDQFVFGPGAGRVTIADFHTAEADALVFQKIPGFTNVAGLAGHVTQAGGSTVIDLHTFGVDLTVTLTGFSGTLNDSNVWFA